jgi:hypothetical protein
MFRKLRLWETVRFSQSINLPTQHKQANIPDTLIINYDRAKKSLWSWRNLDFCSDLDLVIIYFASMSVNIIVCTCINQWNDKKPWKHQTTKDVDEALKCFLWNLQQLFTSKLYKKTDFQRSWSKKKNKS